MGPKWHAVDARGEGAAADTAGRHRLRQEEAQTPYGNIGVKIWVYKGQMLPEVAEQVQAAS